MTAKEATLLGLPQELRDAIYLLAILPHWENTPSSHTRHLIDSPSENHDLYCPWEHNKWLPYPLLQVNRQLRTESLAFIAVQHKLHNITLDMTIKVHGQKCTPEWTRLHSALRPNDTIDALHIHLVVSSTEAFLPVPNHQQPPSPIFQSLMTLLNRFIYNGPSFLDPDPAFATPGPHFIALLGVHVSFEDWYTPATWPAAVHSIFRMLKALTRLDMAYRHIGRVRASAMYACEGKDVQREREWEVLRTEKDGDWSIEGFEIGEAWRIKREGFARPRRRGVVMVEDASVPTSCI